MGKYKKYIWMAGLCCALPLTVSGQQVEPLTGADRLFNEGRELFLRQDYAAARQTLVRYTRQAGEKAWADEVDYMLACTAYELKMPDCREVLSDYLEAHPESRYRNRVQALIGASYFSEEKYMETIATLKGCDISLLSDEERDASALRMGTSYLKVGKLQDAAFWFAVLKETSKDFHNDAVYNLAYIDYVQQKYDTALQGFREVQDDRKFQKLAPYYIADIYLIQGNYAQARKVADAYLALYPEEKYAAQMNRISGLAALMYDGRLPFLVEACNVNWLMTRISPPSSRIDLFITPFSSSKIRRFTIFLQSQSISFCPSDSSMPTNISIPFPMEDLHCPSMVTDAWLTRCTTILIDIFSILLNVTKGKFTKLRRKNDGLEGNIIGDKY